MTDQSIRQLASRLTDAIRAVPMVDPEQAPWPDRVMIDGHDATALLELTRKILRLQDEWAAWKAILDRREHEVEVWRRRADTIRVLLDQANVDLHVESEIEHRARVEAISR